ncbi:aldo/keto reductase family protein [Saccharopolyspora gloriosae]|uniref:Aryl-alcohol dehydrogenase-like predicted oxidoreductase n=1 Tax=Saccharopolyspora gloriosae TaxID=455344 RepID=A0A840ND76_9PSEU|nr:aldo/keto reductase [Saccharopolyspora gloriosae]MBB5070276.1 aryl-alcohol dehydrogenase-like predicted oxidoreductase [Saccharopolyspora gloriosae]
MRYRELGSSGLEVSEIALGSWMFFDDDTDLEANRAVTEAALDAGITLFDTANIYGNGAAELAWGEILSRHPRDSYLLATKVWGAMPETGRGLSAPKIAQQIDASLTRLRTDHVDLYQAHRFDPEVPIEETITALQRVVEQGKARHLGFSEWTPEQIRAAIDLAGPELFASSQPQYSMLWQAPEAELFGLCAENDIAQIVWSPLAQGMLTGKYRPGTPPPEGSRRVDAQGSRAMTAIFDETVALAAVDRLAPIADGAGLDLTTLALAWVLRRGEVAAAIVGASRPEQVWANTAASGVELSPDVLAAVDDALGDAPVTTPTLAPGAVEGVRRG